MPFAKWSTGPGPFVRTPEPHDPSSKTIPDDSFTIKELYERYQAGAPLPLGLERPVRFSDDPTHDDLDMSRISRMDLVEVQDWRKRVADTLYHLEEKQKALKNAKNDDKTTKNAKTEGETAAP